MRYNQPMRTGQLSEISFHSLISHRFRGFSEHENTIAGLIAALDFGVQKVEFDIRVTHCGTPLIYHDEHALDKKGEKRYISDIFAHDLMELGGVFQHMPTADALFAEAAAHANQSCQLLVDIKDAGFEVEIDSLIRAHGLENRTVYVSWVPNVLYRMAEIAPDIPLCLSHWPQSPDDLLRALHHVYDAKDGRIPHTQRQYVHGERLGWYVKGGLKGELRMHIRQSAGSVCLPHNMLERSNIQQYQTEGIEVSAFSFVDWDVMRRARDAYALDMYFIDNKKVFEEHPAQYKLASYGTLAPGRPNHHVMSSMDGRWSTGFVRGHLKQVGWGNEFGYPALIPDAEGEKIPVHIFESQDLPENWDRLDAFETDEYARIILPIETENGLIEASIYRSNHK